MLFKLNTAALFGIDAFLVSVEVDTAADRSLTFTTTGLPDVVSKECSERVTAALRNSGFELPYRYYLINLAPSDIRKEGAAFDLPIALGLLGAAGYLKRADLDDFMIVGELALDGAVRPVRGALSIARLAKKMQMRNVILPRANGQEAAVIEEVKVYPVQSLPEAMALVNGDTLPEPIRVDRNERLKDRSSDTVDFKDVKGQYHAKRALEVAAAGGHNTLMIGPPGSGKSMLARRLPTILPPMSLEEAIETTRIHSVAGSERPINGILGTRPFRSPHHTLLTLKFCLVHRERVSYRWSLPWIYWTLSSTVHDQTTRCLQSQMQSTPGHPQSFKPPDLGHDAYPGGWGTCGWAGIFGL